MDHTLGVCFSLNPNKSTSYLLLCLSLRFFFCNETSRTWASLGPEARQHGLCPAWIPARHDWVTKHSIESQLGKQFQTKLSEIERWWPAQYFVNSGIDGERNWRTGGKSSGKLCWGTPFITCWKNCWMHDLCLQFSLAWSLAQRRLRTDESSPTWATATRMQQIVEPSRHAGE